MPRKSSNQRQSKQKRVSFRRNRSRPARQKHWSAPDEQNQQSEDTINQETVRAKGDLSRKRTVTERFDTAEDCSERIRKGTAIVVRGRFVEVDDGQRVWSCTIRRVLRTRMIKERNPVTVGDQVTFSIAADVQGVQNEGVVEYVAPRRTVLTRTSNRRTHIIAANVDQVLCIASVREPMLKPHLIDRYLVAAHAGNLPVVICVNKVDLEKPGQAKTETVIRRYTRLGYVALATSTLTGRGIDMLKNLLTEKATIIVGQSGVGKSSLLNTVQPNLNLKVAKVSVATEKGRHTTTNATWIKLECGGAIIDTPGIRALDVSMVPISELEMHFVEFVERLAGCKYPNCTHIHEDGCTIKTAVERGEIDPSRYESYVQLFTERKEP